MSSAKEEYAERVFAALDALAEIVNGEPGMRPSAYMLNCMKQLEHAADVFAHGMGREKRLTGLCVIDRMQRDAASLTCSARDALDRIPPALFLADGTEYDRYSERRDAIRTAIGLQRQAAEKYAQARQALERHAA